MKGVPAQKQSKPTRSNSCWRGRSSAADMFLLFLSHSGGTQVWWHWIYRYTVYIQDVHQSLSIITYCNITYHDMMAFVYTHSPDTTSEISKKRSKGSVQLDARWCQASCRRSKPRNFRAPRRSRLWCRRSERWRHQTPTTRRLSHRRRRCI